MINVPRWYNLSSDANIDNVCEYGERRGYLSGSQQTMDEFIEQTLFHVAVLKKEIEKIKNDGIQCKNCHKLYHLKE